MLPSVPTPAEGHGPYQPSVPQQPQPRAKRWPHPRVPCPFCPQQQSWGSNSTEPKGTSQENKEGFGHDVGMLALPNPSSTHGSPAPSTHHRLQVQGTQPGSLVTPSPVLSMSTVCPCCHSSTSHRLPALPYGSANDLLQVRLEKPHSSPAIKLVRTSGSCFIALITEFMKGRLITDNMHNFCNLINAANILESPSAAVATDVQFASRAGERNPELAVHQGVGMLCSTSSSHPRGAATKSTACSDSLAARELL